MRILFVENHAVFAHQVIGQFLAGHEVKQVPTLAAAAALLATQEFDAVLLDYDLEDGKGTELLPIRSSTSRPYVIAVSAHEDGNKALLAAGANAACPKLEFARIGEVLKDALAHRRSDGP